MTKLSLREVFMSEKAVSVQKAAAANLALTVNKLHSGKLTLALYDPEKALSAMAKLAEHWNDERGGSRPDTRTAISQISDISARAMTTFLLGMLHMASTADGKANGAKEISGSAAEDGYGPLLYDIAMSLGPEIMADRYSVSTSAKGVWNYYFKNRPDVEKKPLDNKDSPKTPPDHDDGEYLSPPNLDNPLNWTYSLKRDGSVDASGLIENDKTFRRQLQLLLDIPMDEIDKIIYDAGMHFFQEKYKGSDY